MENNKSFMKETKSELKKVIWPTKQQVINGTATVIAMVVIVGIIIAVFDAASNFTIRKIVETDIGVAEELPDEYTENIDLSDLISAEGTGDAEGVESSEVAEPSETAETTTNEGTAES